MPQCRELVAGTYGDLLVYADGTYNYIANAAVDPLQDRRHRDRQFNFTVTDSLGRTSQPR